MKQFKFYALNHFLIMLVLGFSTTIGFSQVSKDLRFIEQEKKQCKICDLCGYDYQFYIQAINYNPQSLEDWKSLRAYAIDLLDKYSSPMAIYFYIGDFKLSERICNDKDIYNSDVVNNLLAIVQVNGETEDNGKHVGFLDVNTKFGGGSSVTGDVKIKYTNGSELITNRSEK